jgi:ribosome-associated protein
VELRSARMILTGPGVAVDHRPSYFGPQLSIRTSCGCQPKPRGYGASFLKAVSVRSLALVGLNLSERHRFWTDTYLNDIVMIPITTTLRLAPAEICWHAVRSQGSGGQNVNKLATAVHLRFDIRASSLPDEIKARLLRLSDRRITKEGVLVIKAQDHRSQAQNREAALTRLVSLLRQAAIRPRKRRATRPSRAAKQRRLDAKLRRGRTKALRGKVSRFEG